MSVISVIIPVYNVKHYLSRCIDSVLNQTFQDFEVILIDDGSTDGSAEICDEYAGKNEYIKVIHKENGGVSSARNRGMKEAVNEWIAFIDADDWIDRYYLEILYRLTQVKADLVISGGIDVLEGRSIKARQNCGKLPAIRYEMITRSEAYRRMLVCEHNLSVVAWAKLYHAKLFKGVKFPEGEICEDSKVIAKVVEASSRIVCTTYSGYYHLRRRGSLMHRRMSPEYFQIVENAKQLWGFIQAHYPDIEDAAQVFYYNNCIQLINFMILDLTGLYERDCQLIRQKIMDGFLFFIFSRYTKLEEKGAAICLRFGISWYKKVWRMYLRITGKAAGTMIR